MSRRPAARPKRLSQVDPSAEPGGSTPATSPAITATVAQTASTAPSSAMREVKYVSDGRFMLGARIVRPVAPTAITAPVPTRRGSATRESKHAHAGGAEGLAHGQLLLALEAPRDEERREVEHGEQEEHDRALLNEQHRRTGAGQELLSHRLHLVPELAVVGVRRHRPLREGDRVRLSVADRAPVRETTIHLVVARAGYRQTIPRGDIEGNPDAGRVRQRESVRHHADHGVRRAVEAHCSTQHAGVAGQRGLPEGMADHDDARTARFLLVLGERASERRKRAHREEEARGDASHVHRARLAAVVPTRYAGIRDGNGGEAVLDATDELEVGIGFVVMLAAAPTIQSRVGMMARRSASAHRYWKEKVLSAENTTVLAPSASAIMRRPR